MEKPKNKIPLDTINKILEYKSQLTQEKWKIVYDNKTNKEKCKVNKHSTQFTNIHNVIYNKMLYRPEERYIYRLSIILVCLRINK
jgi:hypothetical protein